MITKEYLQQELRRRIDGIKRGVETTTDNIIAEMKSILVLVDALQDRVKDYDDALEKAKVAYKDTDKHIKATVERIFPELRESENERIRKEIINYLDFAESHNLLRAADYEKKKEWLAYLEKQKDAFENGRQLGIMQEQARQELERPDEKQKEQKHPNGCFTCDEYKKGYEAGRLNGFTAGYNKAMKEQKPAEWSEEDETIIEGACNALEIHGHTKLASMLKYIRPSWKPSEEQMNCLCAAVDAAIRKHNESVSGYEPARVLKSLYEDLKKL